MEFGDRFLNLTGYGLGLELEVRVGLSTPTQLTVTNQSCRRLPLPSPPPKIASLVPASYPSPRCANLAVGASPRSSIDSHAPLRFWIWGWGVEEGGRPVSALGLGLGLGWLRLLGLG